MTNKGSEFNDKGKGFLQPLEQTDHHERITRNGRGEDPKYVEFGQCDL